LDLLLVGPTGRKLVLMSDAGGGYALTNVTVMLDDAAVAALPDAARIAGGSYRPANYEAGDLFPAPAPAGALEAALAGFNGTDPNGTWSLFVLDDASGDAGRISGGWSLSLTAITAVNPLADVALTVTDSPDPAYAGDTVTYTLSIFNSGPAVASNVVVTNLLPVGMNFLAGIPSQGTLSVTNEIITCSLGELSPGAGATLVIRAEAPTSGTFRNDANVIAAGTDLNPANNAAQALTFVRPVAPARLTEVAMVSGRLEALLNGEPSLQYVVQGSTNLVYWQPVTTNTLAPNGTSKFSDAETGNYGQRYYRAVRVVVP
jgi:uncharacterized repeat protein (TIGR01451 family)